MRTILIPLSVASALFSFSAAFAADDAAALFKTHCQSCHGADGGRAPSKGVEPIKGQSAADLLKKLEGYKDGTFGGARKMTMENVVKRLSDEQLKALADYSATL